MKQGPQDRLEGRNGAIWRAHTSGQTQEAIAAEYGITQGRVSQILSAVRASLPVEDRADLVRREVDLLDRLRTEALELWAADPIPAYSNGKPIELPDGTVAQDHTGRLAGLKAAVDLHTRLAKMLGLDAATKVEATVTSLEREAAVAAADAAVAFLEGRDGGRR